MPSIDLPVAERKPSQSNDTATAIRFDDVAIAFDHPVLARLPSRCGVVKPRS